MTNAKIVFENLVKDLTLEESNDEISALAFATLHYFGISKTDVLAGKWVTIESTKLTSVISRLNQHEPLQYIFNEAWFYGRKFFVDPSVLIPRPETELLIELALGCVSRSRPINILDIGTGSGCIAITLALQLPNASVMAIDINEAALGVARKNARTLGASVQFNQLDILTDVKWDRKFDLIVSNPPYITVNEKSGMNKNVLQYEPHLALFAPEPDGLIFYRAIAKMSKQSLQSNGIIVVEINEALGVEVASIFQAERLKDVKITKDMAGKNRMISAQAW